MKDIEEASQRQRGAQSTEESTLAFKNAAETARKNKTIHDHINTSDLLVNKMGKCRWFKRILEEESNYFKGAFGNNLGFEMMEYGCDLRIVLRMLCLEYLLKGSISDYTKTLQMLILIMVFNNFHTQFI